MERPSWAPADVDLDRPSVARVYDYYLGGSHNFAADRAFGEQVLKVMPVVAALARSNRAFLRRAVSTLAAQGVRQFLDLGSGIPTVGNVHEVIADSGISDARVVYVDHDPVAVAHSHAILADVPGTAVVAGDLRRPADLLAEPEVRAVLDFNQPIAFLLVAVLHFVPDEQRPADIVSGYAAAGVPGSYVVLSHAGLERQPTPAEDAAWEMYRKSPTPLILRTRAQVAALFGDLTVVEPGVVATHEWRPGPDDEAAPEGDAFGCAAVARKD
ncbi:SAM-dependent methyltransferase [Dactylosporangium fulvum]|uniref:SAM-dependent methyltransferase n=1 Tax=Dactylosporangium fulvum TaxID=53359 RepID=A0ABY5W1A7_9ACTN|nr:SAM-dependent methyltransferase [Dactylosporangium fulvum]UWP83828.1 SAM-dependent methyltransferase [Dactylosporangium fulvum]